MTAAPAHAPVHARDSRRRAGRYPLAIPLDLTVLRSGVPHSIPGRSLDLGSDGMSMALAGEVRLGELVGVEFRLEEAVEPLRARAVVRHHDYLQCGVEFLRLGEEGEDSLRRWTLRMSARKTDSASAQLTGFQTTAPFKVARLSEEARTLPAPHRPRLWLRLAFAGLGTLFFVGMLGWWRWQQNWQQIEAGVPQSSLAVTSNPVGVPASVMEGLLTHRVEPVYPEDARRQNLHGTVVLDAVIGRDGTVVSLLPRSGPDLLVNPAMEAVRWWHYQPFQVNGEPTEAATTIAINF